MKMILGASCVFVCDENFSILDDGGVLFECDPLSEENHILEIANYDLLKTKYPHLPHFFQTDCVLMPALSNAHIHFEFSNNQSELLYGNFRDWLTSVIAQRENLLTNTNESIQREIELQLKSGVASVGAISSYGYDISLLANSPLRVTLFNESIGSNPQTIDFLYSNLQERLEECQRFKSIKFHPALAIHSPYSTHYVLAKRVVQLAEKENLKMSCHFLESEEERQWLYLKKGWFQDFFASSLHLQNAKPSMDAYEFLSLFQNISPLFVHCLFANEDILRKISKIQGWIACAPRSNRLLNNQYLNLEALKRVKIPPIFTTDGLSSNYSLNLIEEIRQAFFGYVHLDATQLAKDLILGITRYPALALGLPNGELFKGAYADLALFECKGIEKSQQKALHFILHTQTQVKELYIKGEKIWKS